jgi:hypothetical protein
MNTTTDAESRADAAVERRIAELLTPEHARAQFDALWARIAAQEFARSQRRAAPRRTMSSLAALAVTLLLGAGIAWYHHAAAPSYTTLADSPRHACRPAPMPSADSVPTTAHAARTASARSAADRAAGSSALCAPEVR